MWRRACVATVAAGSPQLGETSIMKVALATTALVTAGIAFTVGTATGGRVPFRLSRTRPSPVVASATPSLRNTTARRLLPAKAVNEIVQNYCTDCHNDQQLSGNQSLEHFDIDSVSSPSRLAQSERMI